MFKKIMFSLILLLCTVSLFAAVDLGKLSTVTVSGAKTSDDYVASGASVIVITSDDIAKLHAQSTSQVLDTISSVSVSNYGYMGSLENVKIRGLDVAKTKVYLNGAATNMAYDTMFSVFNVNSIPVEMIDRIEIITSGADKNGKSFGAAGVVNIVTKKANGESSFNVAFENGSFLPLKANGAKALVDSQRIVVSGAESAGDFDFAYSINHNRAANNYAYKNNGTWTARENADMWSLGSILNITGSIADWNVSSLNQVDYVNAGSPGSTAPGWGGSSQLTPKALACYAFLSSTNRIEKNNYSISMDYCFNPYSYDEAEGSYNNTEYKSHHGNIGVNGDFVLSEGLSTSLFAGSAFDYATSTNIKDGKSFRATPEFGFTMSGDIKGLKIYPMGKLGYATDMKKFIPEGSLGLEYDFDFGLITTANIAYAVRMPSFSDMFYDNSYTPGNPDLKPESGLSADFGIVYENSMVSYAGSAFIKKMSNEIDWAPENPSNQYSVWTPSNVNKSFYWGFDQTVAVKYNSFSASIGWLFNKSYNLSAEGATFASAPAMDNVRKHTLTFAAGYDFGKVSVNADAKYYGKYSIGGVVKDSTNAFVMNFGVDYKPMDNLSCYAKIDNLLNAQYQLTYGYPMPGTKLRLGVNYKVK